MRCNTSCQLFSKKMQRNAGSKMELEREEAISSNLVAKARDDVGDQVHDRAEALGVRDEHAEVVILQDEGEDVVVAPEKRDVVHHQHGGLMDS